MSHLRHSLDIQKFNSSKSLFCSAVQSAATTPVSGAFKYDMGWQKRGAGRSYDSKSGVGTMIANLSGKIVGVGVRS